MTKVELENRLKTENIPERMYSLDGGLPHDKCCLSKTELGWEVYYSERGSKFDVEIFHSENKACDRFYEKIKDIMKYI